MENKTQFHRVARELTINPSQRFEELVARELTSNPQTGFPNTEVDSLHKPSLSSIESARVAFISLYPELFKS